MSKICLISDLHIGTHKNNLQFLESQIRYFNEEFIPYLKENSIKEVFILGDIFDNRQKIDVLVFTKFYRKIFDKLKDFKVHILLGNHDIYYNTDLKPNSLELFRDYENVEIYDEIKKIKLHDKEILMIPWQVSEFDISNEKADVCMGHLDLVGFNMYKHKISETGCSPKDFYENFKLTFTGHYHIRTEKSNGFSKIIYIGSPYQLTRNDSGEERGFVVLDLSTLEYEYINNKKCIKYITIKYPEQIKKEIIEGNIVDVTIDFDENYNQLKFNEYISEIEKCSPLFPPIPRINNDFIKIDNDKEIDFTNISIESIIADYIKEVDFIENKDIIEKLMNEIYAETKSDLI